MQPQNGGSCTRCPQSPESVEIIAVLSNGDVWRGRVPPVVRAVRGV